MECLRRTSPFYAAVEVRPDGEDVLDGCVLETAEDSALAQELLQKGPADAQGQESDDEKASANIAQLIKHPIKHGFTGMVIMFPLGEGVSRGGCGGVGWGVITFM